MCGKPTNNNDLGLCSFKCLTEWMTEQYGDKMDTKQIDRVGWETNL